MTIALCTLVLNEMEWLHKLYQQHKDWPGLVKWVFVESADRVFADTNPALVAPTGLSVDGTTEWLTTLAECDSRVTYVPYGFSRHPDPALGKLQSREQYLIALKDVAPDFLLILDADEFYLNKDQQLINDIMDKADRNLLHFCFQFTHIWYPLQLHNQPLFSQEVVGGFWAIRHTKGIRWHPDLHYYENHQRPGITGNPGWMQMYDEPHCIHMAFASSLESRKAKHEYYKRRGEAVDRKREWYCESRAAFETWVPGNTLPRGATVVPYTGDIPECFL
jgi:hypothetical protein